MTKRDTAHFLSLSHAIEGVVHQVHATSAGVDPLRGHPGRGPATLENGRTRLYVKASDEPRSVREEAVWAEAQAQYAKGEKLCESPIERSMLAAMLTADWGYFATENALVHDPNSGEDFPDANVVFVPQLRIARFRLDFALVLNMGRWHQIFALECDGKEFHDAVADRERDFYLQSLGIITHRFTGVALNVGPIAATDEVVLGICHWWEAAFNL